MRNALDTLAFVVLVAAPFGAARAEQGTPARDAAEPSESGCEDPMFPLRTSHPAFQGELFDALAAHGLAAELADGSLAVSVADVTDPNVTYYAGFNDDVMMYAASLPKIAILLTVLNAIDRGDIEEKPDYEDRLRKMITVSSNGDAAWGAELVGLEAIEAMMRAPGYCFYEEPVGGLWVGKSYRRGGPKNRDPILDLSHAATARQAARFYVLLQKDRLLSPYLSARMRDLMGPPGHDHKFVGALRDRPGVRFVARKSGTWRTYHSDSALIEHAGRTYVVVGLSDHRRGATLMHELVRAVDDVILEGAYRRPWDGTSFPGGAG